MFDVSVPEPDQLAGLSAEELIDAARACARAENAACARKVAVMAEIFVRRTGLSVDDRENWWVDPDAAVSAELAAAQNITAGLALHQTQRGIALRDRLPQIAALFLDGQLSEWLVRTIITRTHLITDPDLIAAVDTDLAADISTWGPRSQKKTILAIDTLIARHDPDGVRSTCDSNTTRDIQFGSPTDAPGYTSIWARMLAGDAATAQRVITELAYSVCDEDPRTLDERRNDAYAALLAGIPTLACRCAHPDCDATTRPQPRRDTTIYLLTDTTTATADAPRETPGETATAEPETPRPAPAAKPRSRKLFQHCATPAFVFGAGLTPPALLDELTADSTRIREIVHPGRHSEPEPRYTPSRALADYIRCRDLTCRFPGCDTPATLADIDHTVPYPAGPTHPSNLKALCRFHHLLKTFWIGATGWHDRQHPDGTIVWTSPTGHTYTTYPGSRLLFPTLCRPTATLWAADPPTITANHNRGLAMPRRRHTRAHNRARAITTERQRNAEQRAHHPNTTTTSEAPRYHIPYQHIPYQSPSGWHEPDYGNDPPPF